MDNKRGRPRKNGQQPTWMLMRDTTAIYFYDEARIKGEKHSAAVQRAVTGVRMAYVTLPIC